MIERRIPLAGDPFYAGGVRAGSTRHHRCDDDFLGLLEEDFGVARFALSLAFLGVPGEPKKAAIAVTEWAARRDERERALLAWARKNRRRAFVRDVAGDDA